MLREHETKPGRKSSRLVNMVFVLVGAQECALPARKQDFPVALVVIEVVYGQNRKWITGEEEEEPQWLSTKVQVGRSSQHRSIACAPLIANLSDHRRARDEIRRGSASVGARDRYLSMHIPYRHDSHSYRYAMIPSNARLI